MKAIGLGVSGTFNGIYTLFACVSAGFIWEKWGSSYTFIYGTVGALLTSFLLINQNLKPFNQYSK